MIWILLIIFGVLFGLLLLALTLPVVVIACVSGGTASRLTYSAQIKGFGGIAGFEVASDGGINTLSLVIGSFHLGKFNIQPQVNKAVHKRTAPPKPKPEKKKEPVWKRILKAFQQFRAVLPMVKRAIRELWYIVRIDRCAAFVSFGMANPVLMGKVIGGIAVINAILPAPFSIAQSFDFRKQDIQGKLDVSITIRMHRLWNVLFGYVPLLLSTARHKGKQKQKKNIQRSDHIIAEEAA